MTDPQYETKRYDTAAFYLPEGWYTVKELEEILQETYRSREQFDGALKRSMQPILKEKNT